MTEKPKEDKNKTQPKDTPEVIKPSSESKAFVPNFPVSKFALSDSNEVLPAQSVENLSLPTKQILAAPQYPAVKILGS